MSLNAREIIRNLSEAESQLKTAFSVQTPNDFSQFPEIGCCAEHDESFQWYREHNWLQLPSAARENLIDPCEFSGLKPEAYHYFVPGVCQLTLETLNNFIETNNYISWSDLSPWISHLLPSGRKDSTPHNGLRLFTTNEKLVVLAVIEMYVQCHQALEGYAPKNGKFDPFPIARAWWGKSAT
jgi:hypothetical protein